MRLAIRLVVAVSPCVLGMSVAIGTARAQTWHVVDMDASVNVADMCILADGQHGWAVGSTSAGGETVSAILRTTDGGVSWEELTNPVSNRALNGVDFVDPDHGWIVGGYGYIHATTDGGATWVPQTSGTGRTLAKVDFIDALQGWATGGWQDGNAYLVLHTTNGGATWQNQSFGNTCFSCEDICFSDAMHGWIVGRDAALDAHIHHTTDGGGSWSRQVVPAGAGPVSSIDMPTKQIGWASTSSLYHTPAGAILHTTNGGANWQIQGYTYKHYNYCVDAQDTQRAAIAAVQILSPASESIFVTTNGGANWTSHTTPIVGYTYAIQYVGDHIWFGADYSRVFHSTDNGVSWEWSNHAPLWNSMAWSDPLTAWIVAGSNTGTDGYTWLSTDGGGTWQRDPDAPGGAQVEFADPDHGWMLWEGTGASVWRTTDGGGSWNRHYIGGGGWIEAVFFATPDSGWAHGGNGTIRATTNGGVNWTAQSSGTSYFVQVLHFVDAHEGWAGGGYGGGNGFLRHTIDGGATWTPQTPVNADHPQCMFFLNSQLGWYGAVGGNIHHTTDGGQTWQIIANVDHTYLLDILFKNEGTGFLAARNPHGGSAPEDGRGFIYKTVDGGHTWELEYAHPWPRGTVSGFGLNPDGPLWACGQHNTILRYGSAMGLDEVAAMPRLRIDLRAAPNPFAVSTRLSYELAVTAPVRLAVYDVLGRRTRLLVDGVEGPGDHGVAWDGQDATGRRVARGVYFGRLTVGDRTTVSKILLEP